VATEETVAKKQSTFMTAMFGGDRDGCERLLASDFSAVRPDGKHLVEVLLRDQWLDHIAATPVEQVTVTDTVVSAYGPIAVSTVLWIEGTDPDTVRRSATHIWKCTTDGEWQLAEHHDGQ
jgi:ketosteroid isomerase-like protein